MILSGGQALRGLYDSDLKIIDNYGPAECTVVSTAKTYNIENKSKNITIGKPINNALIYILDKYKCLQPIEISGEICIAGAGLARGYLNNEKLTAEKFIEWNGKRIYRTGDIGRWNENGEIEFLGRIDDQVKVRGFRIELGEIEMALSNHPLIRENIVLAKKLKDGENELIAYYTLKNQELADNRIGELTESENSNDLKKLQNNISKSGNLKLTVGEIREFLGKTLPLYMIPAYFIELEKMPLNSSSKIDRKNLPLPSEEGLIRIREYKNPETKSEKILVQILNEVLGVKKISVLDNFFELGGDSIKAIQVIARLNMKDFHIEIKDIFQSPVIKDLAQKLVKKKRKIEQIKTSGKSPLTPVQKWFFELEHGKKGHFNQSLMLESSERIDENIIKTVLGKIVEHHDALRMVYKKNDNEIIQEYKDEAEIYFEIMDVCKITDSKKIVEEHCQKIQSGINLETGPLMKCVLFRTEEKDLLLIVIHHLVIDGVSWRILLEDLNYGYSLALNKEEVKFPLKTDSFKKYAEELIKYSTTPLLLKELEYWQKMIDNSAHEFFNAVILLKNIKNETLVLEKELTEKILRSVHFAYNTKINDILLAALADAFHKSFGKENLLVELETHGRDEILRDINISRTIGWFTAMYPLILKNYDDISKLIKETKEVLRRVPNNGIGYWILKYLTPYEHTKSLQFDKLHPQVLFNYLGEMSSNEQSKSIFDFSQTGSGKSISSDFELRHPIEINAVTVDNKINFDIAYNPEIYSQQQIQLFFENYKTALSEIAEHCISRNYSEKTPSDYTIKNMSISDYDILKDKYCGNIEDIYPLTSLQEGMLYHYIADNAQSDMYFEQTTLTINEVLNIEKIEYAFNKIISRHKALRVRIAYNGLDAPKQVVLNNNYLNINYNNAKNETDIKQFIENYKVKDRTTKFNLENDLLLRVSVIETDVSQYVMILSFHHLIIDGWCNAIIFNEYQKIMAGKEEVLEPAIDYKLYIDWLQNRDYIAAEEFWREYLDGYDTPTKIGFIYDETKDNIFAEDSLELGEEETKKMMQFTSFNNITVNTLLNTAWGIVLAKYNFTSDAVFGTVQSGRPPEIKGIEKMMGLCINTVPVRIRINKNESNIELLRRIQKESILLQENGYLKLSRINFLSSLKNELFNHIIVFENYPFEINDNDKDTVSGKITDIDVFEKINYDFHITAHISDKFRINFSYSESYFTKQKIELLKTHLKNILNEFINNPSANIENISILSDYEKNIFLKFSNPYKVQNIRKTVVDFFESKVSENPDAIALLTVDKEFTYNYINSESNRLANYLITHMKVSPEEIIAIELPRSEKMIIAILGVLKAGCAYLPVSLNEPEPRKNRMIEMAKVRYSISENKQNNNNIETICFNEFQKFEQISNPTLEIKMNSLAYIIFTSGSTGEPKGVMIEHLNLSDYVQTFSSFFNIKNTDVVLQHLSYNFDASIEEIFPILTHGGKLALAPSLDDTTEFIDFVNKNKITVISTVPALSEIFNENVERLTSLRIFICGGDTLKYSSIDRIINYCDVYNTYGPTESTVCAAYFKIEKEYKNIPIGKPINNRKIIIVDRFDKECPAGVPGEILISGSGLARGYLNDVLLTSEKFIKLNNEIFYRTGDSARWMEDGNIEFLGRIDNQVKIRGFRIELCEIEAAVSKHPAVKDSVVVAKKLKGEEKELVAYYTLKIDESADNRIDELAVNENSEDLKNLQIRKSGNLKSAAVEIREFLTKFLPAYMVPAYFVELKKIPLTASGKIDKKNLPKPVESENCFVKNAETKNEMLLEEVWKKVFKMDGIGVNQDFFELGGDSVKLISIVAACRGIGLKVTVKDILENRTIERIVKNMAGEFSGLLQIHNEFGKKSLIAFPLIIGFGYANAAMAAYLKKHTLYTVDYKISDDLFDEYYNEIIRANVEKPYSLFGYSAGGNLAFEFAKYLEMRGEMIELLWLFDAHPKTEIYVSTKEEFDKLVGDIRKSDDYISNDEKRIISFETEKRIRDLYYKTSEHYNNYFNNLITDGKISADIICICSPESEVKPDWSKFTMGKYEILNGAGKHEEMMQSEYIAQNCSFLNMPDEN
ncbi:amino acid adenylation domain-containing protein [Candidatus Dependentiae bacterium]|nr:amino acid adenylation domain-containing protein [Candidatus Dependentiae bacterium]